MRLPRRIAFTSLLHVHPIIVVILFCAVILDNLMHHVGNSTKRITLTECSIQVTRGTHFTTGKSIIVIKDDCKHSCSECTGQTEIHECSISFREHPFTGIELNSLLPYTCNRFDWCHPAGRRLVKEEDPHLCNYFELRQQNELKLVHFHHVTP
jgi:hypothetical protein